jgi:ribosome maturation factor RimP
MGGLVFSVHPGRAGGGRRRFKGVLQSADADVLQVVVDGAEREIPFGLIARASLVPDA